MAKYFDIAKAMVEIGFAKSIAEANRLIKQGAVRLYREDIPKRICDGRTIQRQDNPS